MHARTYNVLPIYLLNLAASYSVFVAVHMYICSFTLVLDFTFHYSAKLSVFVQPHCFLTVSIAAFIY